MKIILLLLLICTSLLAQDYTLDKETGKAIPKFIGQIKLFKGQVYKKSGDNFKKLKMGERFLENDQLITKKNSIAKIIMTDDSIITVGANSQLNFSKFKFTEKNDRKAVYELEKGQISGLIKNKAKEGDIIFKTKSTTMGVRGTNFLINHRDIDNLQITQYAVLSGKIEVTDNNSVKAELEKTDHLILIQREDENKSASEQIKLSDEEYRTLKADHLNDEKDLKPLLPYVDPAIISDNSPLYVVLGNTKKPPPTNVTSSENQNRKGENKKGWEENLKKLNEKLKESQRKQ